MPTITTLRAGKKNPNRVNLYCDGKFVLALSLDEVVRQGLKKGLTLSLEQLHNLKIQDDQERTYQKILNYLSYRPRTISEVRQRLQAYDLTDPEPMLTRLLAHGYLNDLAFAEWFVASRDSSRPRSLVHLRAELRHKGVSSEIINQALSRPDLEENALTALITKKSSRLSRSQLLAYLSRRGFLYSAIKQKLDEMGIKQ